MSKFSLYRFLTVILLLAIVSSPVLAGTAEQNTYVRLVRTGMEQMQAGDYQSARDSFSEALRYVDDDTTAHLGLGLASFHLHQDVDAERELNRALELDPKSVMALQWLGELYYRRDDLESAVASWERALALDPSAEALKSRLERVKKEHRTEKDFNREYTSHFQIKYEGREQIETGRIVRGILEDAYSEIGRGLNYYPYGEIQVILYSGQQFREVTDAPGWSSGLYDGKIRLPIGGVEKETPGLRRLLFHEYTHAVVRSITPRCPTWLNEGLAQYFEGRQSESMQTAMLRKLAQEGKLPALSALEGSFSNLNSSQAALAYLVSLSAVQYLVDNYGMYRVKTVLDELASGAGTATAMSNGILLPYEEFERGWKRSLE
jgi:hypothetical protein